MDLKAILRQVPDFPKPGINFIDITTLLIRPDALQWTIDEMAKPFQGKNIDKIVCMESRGFILGAPLSLKLNAGFVPLRKPNKLPAETYSYTYELEYGSDQLEIHKDAIKPGDRVLIVDDLLATGGTAQAAVKLLKNFDCEIAGLACIVELTFLHGRKGLEPIPVTSLVTYDSE